VAVHLPIKPWKSWTKADIFLAGCSAFIFGITAASWLAKEQEISMSGSAFYLTAAFLLAASIVFFRVRLILVAAIIAFFFFAGYKITDDRLVPHFKFLPDRFNLSTEGTIVRDPEPRGNYQNLVIAVALSDIGQNIPDKMKLESIRLSARSDNFNAFQYGDRVKIYCQAEKPKNNNSDFDYAMYLAKENIDYLCQNAKLEIHDQRVGNPVLRIMYRIKRNVTETINRNLPAPQSGLMVGLLLGGGRELPKDLQDDFSRTGLTHIVAVSGYNVMIIAEYLMLTGLIIGLWRRQAFWLALAGIILFVVVIGLPSSAVRAAIMGGLLLWAMKKGRLASSANAIIFAAAVMLALNPLLLRWDAGFQLSFLATIGVVYVAPLVEKYLLRREKSQGLWEIITLTLGAQIFVLPLILYQFKNLSFISPLANLLVLPIIPATMLLGFLAVVFSYIYLPLGVFFSWLSYMPLKYETSIVSWLSGLPFAATEVTFPWWAAGLSYLILVGLMIYLRRRMNLIRNAEKISCHSDAEHSGEES